MSATVVLETLRRHFAHIAYIGGVLGLMVMASALAAMDAPANAPFGMFTLFTLLAGCQLIGPEFSKGTLQLILSKPIHRSRYLLSRVAGVVLALWMVVALVYGMDVLWRAVGGHNVSWSGGAGTAVAAASQAVLVCALLALFGSFTRSYLNVALYLGINLVMSLTITALEFVRRVEKGFWSGVGALLRAHPGFIGAIGAVHANLYPEPPMVPFDRTWLLMIYGNAAVALLLACLIFGRREVPYGAD